MTGDPSFIPFALPDIGEEEIAEVVDCLRSGWLTTGPRARRFEEEFARFVGASKAIAVNSGTAGLHLALEAVGVSPGDLVVTTPYTFTATAEVIRYLGADPLFVDIDPDTFNLDPDLARAAVAKKAGVKAILPVHYGGQACDMTRLMDLAGEYGLGVVEDAAHALPCTHGDRMIGTFGQATVFSFYATKTLTTGEGGMVATDSAELAGRMEVMRLHGIDRKVWDRYRSDKPSWYYEVVAPGYKYNMPDIMAALGIHQLRKAEAFQRRREEIARYYTEALRDLPVRTPRAVRPEDRHAWHLYPLRLELERLRLDRDQFIKEMAAGGVGASVHFMPLHLHPYWKNRYGFRAEDFPVSLDCYQREVSLPIYTRMSDGEVERVVVTVRNILLKNSR
ncbi:MAG: DegT/DnrJ/EryC1/StrS aminotransferase family protein [Thermodesulfobacteriota bacterium]